MEDHKGNQLNGKTLEVSERLVVRRAHTKASLSRLTLMGPWLSIFIFILRLVFMFRPNRALSEVIVPGRERDFSSMTKKNERVGSFKRGEWGFVEPISSSRTGHYYTNFTKS